MDKEFDHYSPENRRDVPPRAPTEGYVERSSEAGTLQFLHVDEPCHPPNKTHRRAVRQHVMRNFHDQRRKKKVLPPKKHKLGRKGEQDNEASTQSQAITSSGHAQASEVVLDSSDDAASTSETTRLEVSDEIDCPGKPIDLVAPVLADQEEYGFSESGDLNLEPILAHDEHNSASNQFAQFNTPVFNVISPYMLLQVEGAPYLCLEASRWPFPQRLGGNYPKISVWMPQMSEPPLDLRAPRACMHQSARILPYIENSPEYFEFKVNTIKWINDRLMSKEHSLSDTTMGSIMLLTSFEASRGNALECIHHIDGLERIVNLRGGINNFTQRRHIQLKVLLLDMIVATISNTMPRFPILRSPRPLLRPVNIPMRNTGRIYDSPLHSTGTLVDALDDSEFSGESIHTLQRLRNLTIFSSKGLNINTGIANFTPSLPDTRYLYKQRMIDDDDTYYPAPSLDRVIELTSSIYLGALSNPPIPFSSHRNWAAAKELCAAIESPVNDATWDEYPGILVWVLLTGAAAAKEFPEHSLLTSLLIRVGLGAGYGWWEELSEMMVTFMKMKRRAETI